MKITIILIVLLECLAISANAENNDKTELLPLIKACADIGSFDSRDYDIDELMMRFFYSYQNFKILSPVPPYAVSSGTVTMCNSDFVYDALYRAFRINPPTPKPHMLTELGYCEDNGFYSFYGGYDEYFSTDVREIVKIIPQPDGTEYVVFSNYYTQGENPPVFEYSSMTVQRDDKGYYVTAIKMNDDFSALQPNFEQSRENGTHPFSEHLPEVVILLTALSVCIVIYFFFTNR